MKSKLLKNLCGVALLLISAMCMLLSSIEEADHFKIWHVGVFLIFFGLEYKFLKTMFLGNTNHVSLGRELSLALLVVGGCTVFALGLTNQSYFWITCVMGVALWTVVGVMVMRSIVKMFENPKKIW